MDCPICHSSLPEDAAYCPYCGSRNSAVEEFTDYEYEAFISYRHLPKDRTVAVKLQRALEGFAIPKSLRGNDGKRRLGKCFRDEDELPTSSSLSEQIKNALKQSRYLVVVCTPQTRESRWVLQEVELFSAYHGRDRVLAALAEAEPDDSFPELLLSKLEVAEDGSQVKTAVEPMAADFRDLSRSKFNMEAQRIAATLVGCQFDDLRQRARTRRMKLVAGIASGVAAVSIAFSGVTLYQQAQINENYRQIQIRESELLANESAELLAKGDRYQAVQVALAALPESSTSNDRPFVPAAQMALENALGVYPQKSSWISSYSQTDLGDRIYSNGASFSETGLTATVAYDGSITVSEIATGTVVSHIDAGEALGTLGNSLGSIYVGLVFSDEKLIAVYDSAIGCFDARAGTLEWAIQSEDMKQFKAYDRSVALSPDGSTLAVFEMDWMREGAGNIKLIDVVSGSTVRAIPLPRLNQLDGANTVADSVYLDFDEKGEKVAASNWGFVFLIDANTGAIGRRKLAFDYVESVKFIDSRLTVASQDSPIYNLEMKASLEVFDGDLTPLWSKSTDLDIGLDASGTEYWCRIGAFATWNYYEKDDRQLVVLLGKNLYLLDSETGEEVLSIGCDSAFLDCGVLGSDSGDRLYFCTAAGDIGVRIPYEKNSGNGGSIGDANLGAGSLEHGRFVESDGETYLFAWTEDPIKCTVYRNSPSGSLGTEREVANDLSDMYKFVLNKHNDEEMYGYGEFQALRIDANTLEVGETIDLSGIEGADPDALSTDFFGAVSSAGDFYYAAPIIAEEEGRSQKVMGIYRISTDGAIEPFCRINESYLIDMGIANDMSGVEKLQVVARNAVMIIDLDDPLSDESSIVVEVPNIEAAWYFGERTVICGQGVLNDDATWQERDEAPCRFALINSDTGEEVSSDLASYSLPATSNNDELVSVSDDGKHIAAACSDGAVRLFDTQQGSLVWEATDVPGAVRMLEITRGGNILIQDNFFDCYLLSGSTGKTLKASSTPIPRLSNVYRDDGSTIFAQFRETGYFGGNGCVLISLDEEMFGPISIMYNCSLVAADGRTFMYRNGYTGKRYIAERLSLDELINQAHELVSKHQLTNSERHLYNVTQ